MMTSSEKNHDGISFAPFLPSYRPRIAHGKESEPKEKNDDVIRMHWGSKWWRQNDDVIRKKSWRQQLWAISPPRIAHVLHMENNHNWKKNDDETSSKEQSVVPFLPSYRPRTAHIKESEPKEKIDDVITSDIWGSKWWRHQKNMMTSSALGHFSPRAAHALHTEKNQNWRKKWWWYVIKRTKRFAISSLASRTYCTHKRIRTERKNWWRDENAWRVKKDHVKMMTSSEKMMTSSALGHFSYRPRTLHSEKNQTITKMTKPTTLSGAPGILLRSQIVGDGKFTSQSANLSKKREFWNFFLREVCRFTSKFAVPNDPRGSKIGALPYEPGRLKWRFLASYRPRSPRTPCVIF
jgi:hypothetical protein